MFVDLKYLKTLVWLNVWKVWKVSPFSWIWRRKTGWCPCFMPQSDIVGHFRTLWGHCWRNNVVTDTLWKRQYSRLARLLTSWPHVSLNCHATIPSLQSLGCFVICKGFGWCSQAILSPHSIQSDIWLWLWIKPNRETGGTEVGPYGSSTYVPLKCAPPAFQSLSFTQFYLKTTNLIITFNIWWSLKHLCALGFQYLVHVVWFWCGLANRSYSIWGVSCGLEGARHSTPNQRLPHRHQDLHQAVEEIFKWETGNPHSTTNLKRYIGQILERLDQVLGFHENCYL